MEEILKDTIADLKRVRLYNHITIWILIAAIVVLQGFYSWERAQWDYISTTTTVESIQDGAGTNIIGGGDITYGADSESDNNGKDSQEEKR